MFGAPSIVPEVGCRALIAPVSYVQWLEGAVRGLSIPHGARSVKGQPSTGASSGDHAGSTVVAGAWKELICWDWAMGI